MNHDITLSPISGMEGGPPAGDGTALTPSQCPTLPPFCPATHLCKGLDWGYKDNNLGGHGIKGLSS